METCEYRKYVQTCKIIKENKVMKENEAPEKIYVDTEDRLSDSILYGFTEKHKEDDIEYVRKDAFMEKALKWYCLDCECNDNCKDTKCFFHNAYKRYLEGDTNSLPPKFSDTILNEDGSTSDNWRYRHFTSKMQDVFIEKAKKWFEEQNEWRDINGIKHCDMESFDDFKKYMKE